jgi:hypothetical protein
VLLHLYIYVVVVSGGGGGGGGMLCKNFCVASVQSMADRESDIMWEYATPE